MLPPPNSFVKYNFDSLDGSTKTGVTGGRSIHTGHKKGSLPVASPYQLLKLCVWVCTCIGCMRTHKYIFHSLTQLCIVVGYIYIFKHAGDNFNFLREHIVYK